MGRGAEALATEDLFLDVTEQAEPASSFLFPGLKGMRIQLRRPSSWCSSINPLIHTSSTSDMGTVMRSVCSSGNADVTLSTPNQRPRVFFEVLRRSKVSSRHVIRPLKMESADTPGDLQESNSALLQKEPRGNSGSIEHGNSRF